MKQHQHNKKNNEQPQNEGDSQSNTGTQVVKADIENNTDAGNAIANNSSGMSQSQNKIQAPHDSM